MKNSVSISMNLLRISLLLVFLGLFMPLGCKASGFQIAQGFLGNHDDGGVYIKTVSNFYALLVFAVFIIAAIGLLITFISNINNNFLLAFGCLVISFVILFIVLVKLNVYFNFNNFSFYANKASPVKIELLIGGYIMIIGYIGGIIALVLNKSR